MVIPEDARSNDETINIERVYKARLNRLGSVVLRRVRTIEMRYA